MGSSSVALTHSSWEVLFRKVLYFSNSALLQLQCNDLGIAAHGMAEREPDPQHDPSLPLTSGSEITTQLRKKRDQGSVRFLVSGRKEIETN